ncbi:MAG: BrnA antitoxin family protein [Candidatus Devosia euplotis]|nr:BrnA antitoxin family protein [Candidatus Devosia euplotis]
MKAIFTTAITPPEGPELGDDFWANAVWVEPQGSTFVHLKLDPEVFAWFKSQGKGHITRMQDVLKVYVKAHKGR